MRSLAPGGSSEDRAAAGRVWCYNFAQCFDWGKLGTAIYTKALA